MTMRELSFECTQIYKNNVDGYKYLPTQLLKNENSFLAKYYTLQKIWDKIFVGLT